MTPINEEIEKIEVLISAAIAPGFRGRLLDRGRARSMIWVNGKLPEGAPNFAEELSYDLLSYGYSLLSLAIRLKELGGNIDLCYKAFEKSANAIMDVIHNGEPEDIERGFHKVLAASSYHLGRFSAKSYSLLQGSLNEENLSKIETLLSLLMLRRFNELEDMIFEWKESGEGSDEYLANKIETEIKRFNQVANANNELEEDDIWPIEIQIINEAITDNYFSAIFEFLFALETGNTDILEGAISRIDTSLTISGELNFVPQWWVLRITKHLLRDLWESSFHRVLPLKQDDADNSKWQYLRWLFIASLYKREKSEIDLWPSQLEGAKRAINDEDDLIVSLPTSAGKTRIAELCILRCLAIGKRVLFITPLRALSAQTESSLRKTFLPLGKTVSSLYGSMGTSDLEQDVLKTRDIVVGTPEKLDFALRNDPTIIDDIGLVVLDEGHMIGLGEREIRYEVQIQRLLKRKDADQRRIVCLSAILPSGEQFEDFVNWLRRDKEGTAIQSEWRPTDLRYGEIIWKNKSAQLNFVVGEEQSFIPNLITSFVSPRGKEKPKFPNSTPDLTLASAWELIENNHTVLIYCPQKRSVNGLAKNIIKRFQQGVLKSVLIDIDKNKIELAKALGREWLGDDHPIIKCLSIGVAIHHGGLPTPFRKEMERLLRNGILKITVSSPTLAQGLNLAATAIIFHSLSRNRKPIQASEFQNVAGRAGRAFVDTHGLVLHPIFDKHTYRNGQWKALIKDNTRIMESGLVLLVVVLIMRIAKSIGSENINDISEYILNNNHEWDCPNVTDEKVDITQNEKYNWDNNIVMLDTALLSMLGSEEVPIEIISDTLDTVLQSSLWQRRLSRMREEQQQVLFTSVLSQRAKYIWSETTPQQRKGYFLAGVGLETGQKLDEIAPQANVLLVNANIYINNGDEQLAIESITELAAILLGIPPFAPKELLDNWQEVIKVWLEGKDIADQNFDVDKTIEFIEDVLVYRLPWGVEALRVRAQANEDKFSDGRSFDDFEVGFLVPAIENGTLNISAAMLMQAGFSSRLGAIEAIKSTDASFKNKCDFKYWLDSDLVRECSEARDWPTAETALLWNKFRNEYQPPKEAIWKGITVQLAVVWKQPVTIYIDQLVKLHNYSKGRTKVLSSDGEIIGELLERYDLQNKGIYYSQVIDNGNLQVTFWGTSSNPFEIVDMN